MKISQIFDSKKKNIPSLLQKLIDFNWGHSGRLCIQGLKGSGHFPEKVEPSRS